MAPSPGSLFLLLQCRAPVQGWQSASLTSPAQHPQGTMPLCQDASGPGRCHPGIRGLLRKGCWPPPAIFHFCDQKKDFVIGKRHLDETTTIFFTCDLPEPGTCMAGTPQHPTSHLHLYLVHLWHDGATVALLFHNHHIPDVGHNLPTSCTRGLGVHRGASHTPPPPLCWVLPSLPTTS